MKRKVVLHGSSTLIISLPQEWAKKYGINKGQELDVIELDRELRIKTENTKSIESTEINVSDFDRTAIKSYICGAYRMGFDVITINFDDKETTYKRLGRVVLIKDIIQEEVDRFVGMEIISATDHSCIIKDVSHLDQGEFDNIFRRIFLLTFDLGDSVINLMQNKEKENIENVYSKHKTVTRLINYCLRLLNKYGYNNFRKTCTLYHIVSSLDQIVDLMKYSARNFESEKVKLDYENIRIMNEIITVLRLFYESFYKFDSMKIKEIDYKRREIDEKFSEATKKGINMRIISKWQFILEIIFLMREARFGLACLDNSTE